MNANDDIHFLKYQITDLRFKLKEAEEALNAIRSGHVNALLVNDGSGSQKVYTSDEEEPVYRLLIEEMNEGAVTLNEEGLIVYANKKFAELISAPLNNIMGSSFSTFLFEGDYERFLSLLDKCHLFNIKEEFVLLADDEMKNVIISANRLSDENMNITGLVITDITERSRIENQLKKSLYEKDILLKEIHHRVKNNLQIISSLLNIQLRNINDEKVAQYLRESKNRIISMSIVHEKLYQTQDFSRINLTEYTSSLVSSLLNSYSGHADNYHYTIESINVFVPLEKAISVGLIINELITNIIKHAFNGKDKGEIFISIKKVNDVIHLLLKDDGRGFPPDYHFETTDTLGMKIVNLLTKQLKGEIRYSSIAGTEILLTFKG